MLGGPWGIQLFAFGIRETTKPLIFSTCEVMVDVNVFVCSFMARP